MAQLVYLSLGSNLGDRIRHLRDAIRRLGGAGRVVAVSAFYETEPVEFTEQPWFLNCVAALQTALSPENLLASLLGMEREMGRDREREQKKGPRVIDLDILLFGNGVVKTTQLTIPHPAMHERRFVLEPLAEIAANVVHPVLERTVERLLRELPAGQSVRKMASQPGIDTNTRG